MVAEAVYAVPHPGKLASDATSHLGDACPSQELLSPDVSSQDAAWVWTRQEDRGGRREQSDGDEDQESDIIVKAEIEYPRQSVHQTGDDHDDRLVIVDVKKEGIDDELEESGEDVEECSSTRLLGDEGQGKKGHGSPCWRKKGQRKIDHGRQWIMDKLLLVTTSMSVVSLDNIEKAYHSDCHKEGQEPLTRFGLARLIHQQFPEAGKCRLGSRGNQKIHYSKMQWRSSSSPNQCHMSGATSTLENEAAEGIPRDNIPPAEIQGKGKQPASGVSQRDTELDLGPDKSDGVLLAARKALVRAALQPAPEDEDVDLEGCEDAANRLVQVVKSLKSQGKFDVLLKTFAHSASCNSSPCYPLCLMFRRVRHHVVSARHACYVMRIYSVLLKLHVAYCDDNNCGMTACPALRASKQMKRGRDEELQEEEVKLEQKQEFQHTTKKNRVQIKLPSSLIIRVPSPVSSLPDSEPSTPSPSISPSYTDPPSPVRIAPLPPLAARRGSRIPSEHGGA